MSDSLDKNHVFRPLIARPSIADGATMYDGLRQIGSLRGGNFYNEHGYKAGHVQDDRLTLYGQEPTTRSLQQEPLQSNPLSNKPAF